MRLPRPSRAQQLSQVFAPAQGQREQRFPIPVPVGGINTRDAENDVQLTDALELDNWTPRQNRLATRKGFLEHTDSDDIASHVPSSVQTLAVFKHGGVEKLIAADGGTIYDATTVGSPSALSSVGTFTVNRWDTAMFDGKLIFVNGTDTPQQYVDSSSGSLSTLTITGPSNPIGVNVFKNRTWFWDDNSQKVWYSALNAAGGACTEFPLNRVSVKGGDLLRMVTWTRDGGSGPDDFAVFIFSTGDVAVYQGSYPGESGDWALVGIYHIGEPVNDRAVAKFGGDVLIATTYDVVSLQEVLAGVEAMPGRSKIVGLHVEAVEAQGGTNGWEIEIWGEDTLGIVNVPTSSSTFNQHVFHTGTKAWARWTGLDAHTWQVYDGRLFFGAADGKINEFGTAYYDGTNSAAGVIVPTLRTAWIRPQPGTRFSWRSLKHAWRSTESGISITNEFFEDFEAVNDSITVFRYVVASEAAWGDPWGTGWGGSLIGYRDWEGIGRFCEALSIRVKMGVGNRLEYYGSIVSVEGGYVL